MGHSTRNTTAIGAYIFLGVIAFIALTITLASCGGPAVTQGTSSIPSGSSSAGEEVQAGSSGYREITFESTDGLAIGGRLYGSGTKYIILSHMYPADQTSWDQVAPRLAGEGYCVLTFDFRGYGTSEGSKDIKDISLDLEGALKYAATAGATDVMFVGASMGGTASLIAAAQFQVLSSVRVAGVATLSAPVEFQGLSAQAAAPQIEIPMLLVAAQDDVGAAEAEHLQELAGGRARIEILPGTEHGSELFTGPEAEEVWRLLLQFVADNMGD
jgi:pimeloyl-ACP methyl ester carboxylesterase